MINNSLEEIKAFVKITPDTHNIISNEFGYEFESHCDYNKKFESYAIVSKKKGSRGCWYTENDITSYGNEYINCNNQNDEDPIQLFIRLAKSI